MLAESWDLTPAWTNSSPTWFALLRLMSHQCRLSAERLVLRLAQDQKTLYLKIFYHTWELC